jgi:hypothetical protein
VTGALWVILSAAPSWQSLDGTGLENRLRAMRTLPLEARFVAATEGFLGTKYAVSPLGEGEGRDADPLLRFDAADCLTMVEESMALALTPDEARLVETLNGIRYQTPKPSYEGRLHIMEAQWLPLNVARGYLENVTSTYSAGSHRRVLKEISSATWREKSGASLQLTEAAQPTGEFAFDIIPAARVLEVLDKAPSGLIVVVVRADRPKLVSRITHVGVLIQKKGGVFLRHASRSFKRVVDEPLERYLRRNLEFGVWTVEGVALYRVMAPQQPPEASVGVREHRQK